METFQPLKNILIIITYNYSLLFWQQLILTKTNGQAIQLSLSIQVTTEWPRDVQYVVLESAAGARSVFLCVSPFSLFSRTVGSTRLCWGKIIMINFFPQNSQQLKAGSTSRLSLSLITQQRGLQRTHVRTQTNAGTNGWPVVGRVYVLRTDHPLINERYVEYEDWIVHVPRSTFSYHQRNLTYDTVSSHSTLNRKYNCISRVYVVSERGWGL